MDNAIIDHVRSRLASDVHLKQTNGKLRIDTPLVFDDGDHCSVFLVERGEGFVLSDLGDVFMRASYEEADLSGSGHKTRFERLMSFYGMEENGGQITMPVSDDQLGSGIFSFAQGVLELVHLASMPAERRKKAEKQFKTKVANIVKGVVPSGQFAESWHDPQHDPNRYYPVDIRIEAPKELYLFAVGTGMKCLHATVSCQHYKLQKRRFLSIAIYRDEKELPQNAVAPLNEVVDKQFKASDEEAIADFIRQEINPAA